jgi:hypothetical protein
LDYEIENISSSDYELKIFLKTNNNAFNVLLKKSISKLQRRMAGVKSNDFDKFVGDKEFIMLPEMYYYMLATALKPSVKNIKTQVLSENVTLISGKITSAFYRRDTVNNLWELNVIIQGGYKDVKYK